MKDISDKIGDPWEHPDTYLTGIISEVKCPYCHYNVIETSQAEMWGASTIYGSGETIWYCPHCGNEGYFDSKKKECSWKYEGVSND